LARSWTRFVDVSSLSVVPVPDIVHALIHQLSEQCSNSWNIELNLGVYAETPEVALIPLAGLLLEYPVAYVVAPDSQAYLSRVPLDVYECTLQLNGNEDQKGHSVLKFSIPETLGNTDQVWRPGNIMAELHSRFSPRVNLGSPTSPRTSSPRSSNDSTNILHVHHHTVSLDRVAL
jgi:hypothetical protein